MKKPTVTQLVSRLDILFFETSEKSFVEYQDVMDQLEKIDYSAMIKVANRHSRW